MANNELVPVNSFCIHHKIEYSFITSLQQYGLVELNERFGGVKLPKIVLADVKEETKRKIETDPPDRIAQQCDTYIKILKENPEIAFKTARTSA